MKAASFKNRSLEDIAIEMKFRSRRSINWGTEVDQPYLRYCTAVDWKTGSSIIFTRDAGMHTCGWWKNPDYERCFHLSLGFFDLETEEYREKDAALTDRWIEEFFGPTKNLLWAEPPFSEGGKEKDIWHYRVFMHEDFATPLLPRGEVYSKTNTPPDWLSFSDLKAKQEAAVQRVSEILGIEEYK
mgnify:CR=1 FL=1